jgi:hypothetical protein
MEEEDSTPIAQCSLLLMYLIEALVRQSLYFHGHLNFWLLS